MRRMAIALGVGAAALVAAGSGPAEAATVTPVGAFISADTADGSAAAAILPVIVVREQARGDVGVGTVVLRASDGFAFDAVPVTVRSADKQGILLGRPGCLGGGTPSVRVLPDAADRTRVTFAVCGTSRRAASLSVEGLAVRATAGFGLGGGTVALDGVTTIAGLAPTATLATLAKQAGVTESLFIEPYVGLLPAGEQVQLATYGGDRFGNPSTTAPAWSIEAYDGAGGTTSSATCSTAGVCSATDDGGYLVTATAGRATARWGLNVVAGPAVALWVSANSFVAGQPTPAFALGRDQFGNDVRGPGLDELSLEPVAGGGGSAAASSCDLAASTCTSTDTGSYAVRARVGDALAVSDPITVFSALPSTIEATLPATTPATVDQQWVPFTVTVRDVYGNPVDNPFQHHYLQVAITKAGSGVDGLPAGPSVFPRDGFPNDGPLQSRYDAGALPGTDEVTATLSEEMFGPVVLTTTFHITTTLVAA